MKVMPRAVVGTLVVVAVGGLMLAANVAADSQPPPRSGPVPDDAFNGPDIDRSKVPEYVETIGPDGSVVGYSHRDDIMPGTDDVVIGGRPGEPPVDAPTPVYAEDFSTIVGHMYPGIGFVPLGEEPGDDRAPTVTTLVPPE